MHKRFFGHLYFSLFYFAGVHAQPPNFNYDQVFKDAPTGLTQPLPVVLQWLDEEHWLESRQVDGSTQYFSTEAKTGKSMPYPYKPTIERALPAGQDNAAYSPDGQWLAFTKSNNLFVQRLSSGETMQITSDGDENISNGYTAYLYYEEILGRSRQSFWWSPDSKRIAFIRYDETKVPVFPITLSSGIHGTLIKQHYPQAGDNNPLVKLGIVSLDKNSVDWIDLDESNDCYLGRPAWVPDGSALWAQWVSRDQHTLKIFSIDSKTLTRKLQYREDRATWVNPRWGIHFLPGARQYILYIDSSGWNHAYLFNINGTLDHQLSSGHFTTTGVVRYDEKKKLAYFLADRENSARQDLYVSGTDCAKADRLTQGEYFNEDILFSPSGNYFISTCSNMMEPPKMVLYDKSGKLLRELASSRGPAFNNYTLGKAVMLRVRSGDGRYNLPVKILFPLNFTNTQKYPVLVEVYGGPGLGKVYDQWSNDLRRQWWANEGIIQVWIDNRSSGHFGRAGMDAIYGQCGKYEVDDFLDCARWLRKQPYCDTSRICITGYSYGGFMTCMAMTRGAGLFSHGLAYYPLTNWSCYDSYYAEKYMGSPLQNAEGYRITSPTSYAGQYRGLLRIVHGEADDNVHLQQTLQFVSQLQDLQKHVELLIYPAEKHGRGLWSPSKKTSSRYEDCRFIYEQLLQKPIPEVF